MYYLVFSIILNIILLLIFYTIYNKGYSVKCNDYPIYNKILLSKIQEIGKSGDLLLFSNSRCNIITRSFGNHYYSHIGIILKKNNKLYTLELVRNDYVYPKESRYQNLLIIPLEDRILNYSGMVYYCNLIKPLTNNMETKLIKISNKNIKYSINKGCGYFIGNILEELDIAKNILTWKLWNIHNNIINLTNNTIYNNPILIIPDQLIINNINDNKLLNYC